MKLKLMTQIVKLVIALLVVAIFACTKETSLEIVCPLDLTVDLSSSSTLSNTIILPPPNVITNCGDGQFEYSIDLPEVLHVGEYTVTYHVTNFCGDEEICSFKLNTKFDFRSSLVGNYVGRRHCWTAYPTNLYLDTIITVNVNYGNHPNTLLMDGEEVIVDSTGTYPYPAGFGSYRLYQQFFKHDTLHMYQQWGLLNSNDNCSFTGKKQ